LWWKLLFIVLEQIIVKKDAKSVYKIVNCWRKRGTDNIRLIISAFRVIVPPMIMYAYKRMPATNAEYPQRMEHWNFKRMDDCWVILWILYITNVFYPLKINNIVFPIILFISSHLPLSNFCQQHEIELIALYPNATYILQPLDVAVFHPLKLVWKKTVNNWKLENNEIA